MSHCVSGAMLIPVINWLTSIF